MKLTFRKRALNWFAPACALSALGLNAPADATTDTSTMTIAVVNTGFGVWVGFEQGAFGIMSPTTLTGGKTYIQWWEYPLGATFEIAGFTSDPGQSWLTTANCVGTTKGDTTATYSYGSGHATWKWTTLFGFAAWVNAGHSTALCTVVHR